MFFWGFLSFFFMNIQTKTWRITNIAHSVPAQTIVLVTSKIANSWPSASNFKSFSRLLEHFFLTVGQNNFGNKIPFSYIFFFKKKQELQPIMEQTSKKVKVSICHWQLLEKWSNLWAQINQDMSPTENLSLLDFYR